MKKYLILFGIIEIPAPLWALYILFPLLNLQKTLGTNSSNSILSIVFFGFALLVALIQLVMGLFSFDVKLGMQKIKGLIGLGLILGVLAIPAIIVLVLNPIYSSVSTLK